MRYYSDIVKKFFDSENECKNAEKEYTDRLSESVKKTKELAEKRKERAKEVEDAYKAYQEAYRRYIDLRTKFCKDYKTFHMTFTTKDDDELNSIFEEWLHIF